MDLGIAGRKAIVCASSRGLGRGCAIALAAQGCVVVINGRDPKQLDITAAEIRAATGATVIAVEADVATKEGQDKLFAACPEPRGCALVCSNWRPEVAGVADLPGWPIPG